MRPNFVQGQLGPALQDYELASLCPERWKSEWHRRLGLAAPHPSRVIAGWSIVSKDMDRPRETPDGERLPLNEDHVVRKHGQPAIGSGERKRAFARPTPAGERDREIADQECRRVDRRPSAPSEEKQQQGIGHVGESRGIIHDVCGNRRTGFAALRIREAAGPSPGQPQS